jgi:uracil-DNA glycosylase family 4
LSLFEDYFDLECRACSRLSDFMDGVKEDYPDYHCRPVEPFGDPKADLLIVGLAPGKHGANASGRPFTGDFAGILLFRTLYEFGWSSAPESLHRSDGLTLTRCRLTNAVKCLPPENKPVGAETRRCNPFLAAEIATLKPGNLILALGGIAHRATLMALGLRQAEYQFGHDNLHHLPTGVNLLDSYHCSRYNTQTRRLTPAMFKEVFAHAQRLLNQQ